MGSVVCSLLWGNFKTYIINRTFGFGIPQRLDKDPILAIFGWFAFDKTAAFGA